MKPNRTISTKGTLSPKVLSFIQVNGNYDLYSLSLPPLPPPPPSPLPLTDTFSAFYRAITRDPSLYPSPSSFNPDRWLSPSYPTYRTPLSQYPSIKGFTTFGYGRRYCQGVDLVEAELICGIGGMAWAFDKEKGKKMGGGEQMEVPDHDYTSLLISRPKPFEYSLSARTPAREAALRQEWRGLQEQRKRKMMEKDQRGMTRKRGLDANYATMEKMDGLTTGIREWDGLPN